MASVGVLFDPGCRIGVCALSGAFDGAIADPPIGLGGCNTGTSGGSQCRHRVATGTMGGLKCWSVMCCVALKIIVIVDMQ